MTGTDKIRVLCVEDEALDRQLIRHALERESADFEVIEAVSRESFLERLAHSTFDVILTDFNIMGFEGLDVIHEVKERGLDAPVIVVTGTGSEEIAVSALKEGAEDYVIKSPHHIAQLPQTIARVLETAKTRRKLAESEANIRALVENTADGVLVVDKEGTILFCNPASAHLLGTGTGELIGTRFAHDFASGRRLEIDLPRRTGQAGTAEMVVAHIVWNGDECHIVTLRDTTERRNAENQLRRSTELLSETEKTGKIGGWAFDVETLAQTWTDETFHILEIEPTEGEPQVPEGLSFIADDSLAMAEEAVRRAIEFGEPYDQEWEIVTARGNRRWVHAVARVRQEDGKVKSVSGSFQDITERKQAERALRESEDRYRALVDMSPDAVLVNMEGKYVYANPAAHRLYGTASPNDLVGTRALDHIHPDDRELVTARVAKLRSGEPVGAQEMRIVRLDGSSVYVEALAGSVEFDGNAAIQVLLRDITDRKEAEKMLLERDEQLRQSQKMEAMGQLAGGIAHDFNNLLTAIIGYSEMLLLDAERPEGISVLSGVQEIKRAAERAAALTRQILAFSRRQALHSTVVSLNRILNDMEPFLRRTLGEDIDLTTRPAAGLDETEVDVNQFEQVLMNLAVNARDAMPCGGRLTVETANVLLDEDYCRTHLDALPGSYVMLSVTDTGTGMDQATLSRIFEPFFTTKAPGAGTGLGLSTVYGIVKQSGGSIDVSSDPGRGTTFAVYLPRTFAVASAPAGAVPTDHPSDGTGTILLVEDEDAIRDLAARILGGIGYTVLTASTADEGCRILSEIGCSIDLLVTDMVLPGALQGDELVRYLRGARPSVPVLRMSGYPHGSVLFDDRSDTAGFYLEKPFSRDTLVRKVQEALRSGRV